MRDIFTNIKNKNSKDCFGVPVKIMKLPQEILIITITKLINSCLRECTFPDIWKRALVIPIIKEWDKNDMNNYRPKSLLPVLSKIYNCIGIRISEYLEKNELLTDRHFAFRTGMSTANGIIDLVSYILEYNRDISDPL